MGDESENRGEERISCEADIEWAYFNRSEVHAARMLNISKSGSYFECSHPIIPGATILIRVHKKVSCSPADSIETHLRTAALGEVKWCRELADDRSSVYGIGIRYYLPV